jgi:hypothetical protein
MQFYKLIYSKKKIFILDYFYTALAPACRITLLPEMERPKKISAVALKLYVTIKGTPNGVGII